MNLTINPAVSNNASPNFGMAVKVDTKALPVIKREVMKLSTEGGEEYWKGIQEAVTRQQDNPVNIIIKKINGRQALKAYVVDAERETAVPNIKIKQGLFHKTGSLEFLNDAEAYANDLNSINQNLSTLEIATKADLRPPKATK